MTPDDIAPEFRFPAKDYRKPAPIEGVRILRLNRLTDDRGFFLEIFRSQGERARQKRSRRTSFEACRWPR